MRTLTILTAGSIRAFLFGGLIAVITTGVAAGQTTTRPPVGGVGSPPDAMIFYVAHGAADACGPGCSDWIAAEGTVQFDTNRRLIAILDRQAGRKLPLVIHASGSRRKPCPKHQATLIIRLM